MRSPNLVVPSPIGVRFVESSGMVSRKVFDDAPPKGEYSLIEVGQVFIEPLRAICDWAEKNAAALLNLNRERA